MLNYIDLFFIVTFSVMIFSGFLRGFLVSALSLARFVVAYPLAFFLCRNYSDYVYNNWLRDFVLSQISKGVEQGSIKTVTENALAFVNDLPYGLSKLVDTSFLENSNGEFSKAVLENIVDPVAPTIVKILIFILTIILFYVITWIIMLFFKKRNKDKKSLLYNTNKVLGGVFGLVKGVVFVFVVCAILNYVSVIFDGSSNSFISEIQNSKLLNFIVPFNPIITYFAVE